MASVEQAFSVPYVGFQAGMTRGAAYETYRSGRCQDAQRENGCRNYQQEHSGPNAL